MPEHENEQHPSGTQDQEGQVSEVSGLPAESEIDPISPGDATAGSPEDGTDQPQEGTAGPDAPPRHGRPEESNESSR
ncbi:hypothetical protein [Nocardioides sp.]|uniref:hypothetical protein n=1 Tax=Nocardioides sp. TaxID=35761 RepID=UPI0027335AEA|nr:hypothetical protein [Nocardioides sp.]MDP3893481.1 hypothetical protein [Nocardioides sp.]